MNVVDSKRRIIKALADFSASNATQASLGLFEALGYAVERQAPFPQKTADYFIDAYSRFSAIPFNAKKALCQDWSYADLLFQLTKEDVVSQQGLFDTSRVDDTIMESYLFFAVGLSKGYYSRGDLARITREINKVFPMPVLVLFRYGDAVSLSIIDRRLNKKDDMKDVLEKKVTLIKDLRLTGTHRAHIEILFDLSYSELTRKFSFRNFVELHKAWRATLDISALNKKFYQELSNWYFWAMKEVRFPDDAEKDDEIRNATNLIRLITRVIFVWFIREKQLVSDRLFDRREMGKLLKGFLADGSANSYYPAILQNLFFATLNQKMGERCFIEEGDFLTNRGQYGVKTLYRYANLFAVPTNEALELFKDVPFLNGGLFDCLDKADDQNRVVYVDGFSRNQAKRAFVPDRLFFDAEHDADLNEVYGTSGKTYKVKGLIDILEAYKFTIAENTPVEEEVALDPELLGKVFENLLASYNPETKSTARHKTGSFYTPREIVDYMVDETLKSYLTNKLNERLDLSATDAKTGLDILFMYTEQIHAFSERERDTLIEAIDSLKILDPACGSGAFPMGILHKLVYILHKLDPGNELWEKRQIEKARNIDDPDIRERALEDIQQAFSNNELDYGRKLYLIENCVYGADIQPIAVQIAKLRFFISLVIDQNKKPEKENLGIRSLPNLETKFVAADSLIALKTDLSELFHEKNLLLLEDDLKALRHRYFAARNRKEKLRFQARDKEIRDRIVDSLNALIANRNQGFTQQIAQIEKELPLRKGGEIDQFRKKADALRSKMIDPVAGSAAAHLLSRFDPYDQNASAPFFDPEWMFGLEDGFDIVIGNPPYVQIQSFSGKSEQGRWEAQDYATYAKTGDIYCLFYERGFKLLSPGGSLCYITSNKWMRANYGKALRAFFLNNGKLRSLIDFGDSPIFENATTYTNILLWQADAGPKRSGKAAKTETAAYDLSRSYEADASLPVMLAKRRAGEAMFTADSFVIADGAQAAIKRRIEQVGTPLKDWDIAINYGIKTGLNEAFIIDQAKYDELVAADPRSKEILKPILRGRDIKRYKAEWAGLYLIATFPALHLDIDQYLAVRDHLMSFGKALEQTGKPGCRKKTNNKWFEVQDTIAYWEEFNKQKVVFGIFMDKPTYYLDKYGYCVNNALNIGAPATGYIASILNSHISWYYLKQLCTPLANGFIQAMIQYQIPIPHLHSAPSASPRESSTPLRESPYLVYEVLVDCVQFARVHELLGEADTLEAVIDVMVYGLYFEPEMKAAGCYINDRVAEVVRPFKDDDADEFKTDYVKKLADFCKKDAIVYNGLIQSRNVDLVKTVLGETKT